MFEFELAPGVPVGGDSPPVIIAEIGQNHQGSLETAKQMILAAKTAGADIVKFQKSNLEAKFTAKCLEQPYDSVNSWGKTYGEHKRYLEFSEDKFQELMDYAKELNIACTASAMDILSARFLNKLNVPFIKIGSGDVNNLPLIKEVCQMGKPVVLSTGMADMQWVRKIIETVKESYTEINVNPPYKLVLMHCVSSYPCKVEDVNLEVMNAYRKEFPDLLIGYSGHEEGIGISIKAAEMGATVIERHFTLDKSQKGTDHSCSLNPEELALLVKYAKMRVSVNSLRGIICEEELNNVEKSIGDGNKKFLECEKACYNKLGKCLVTARDIIPGEPFNLDACQIKVSHVKGIDPRNISEWVGFSFKVEKRADEPIFEEDLVK